MRTSIVVTGVASLALAVGALWGNGVGQDPAELERLMEQTRPGSEHGRLTALVGEWELQLVPPGSERPAEAGTAQVEELLGGRFIDVDCQLGSTELRYTLGFDRRHGEHSLILMDTAGTYAVTARGPELDDGPIRMRGEDDDPYMASLGFEKRFAFDLEFDGPDQFSLKLYFVDTRPGAPEGDAALREAYTHLFTR